MPSGPIPHDHRGKKFGKLTPLVCRRHSKNGKYGWECLCDCGNSTFVLTGNMVRGISRSCGCLRRKISKETLRKRLSNSHHMTKSREYRTWQGMKARCYKKSHIGYKDYGGRGIRVCDRWLNSFENFLLDMGSKPVDKTIDRIDNDGDYSPSNCRWATHHEQEHNKRNSIILTYNGKTMCLTQWADYLRVNRSSLYW